MRRKKTEKVIHFEGTIISPKYDFCARELFENPVVRLYFCANVLNIPVEDIKSVRIKNCYLWKRQKNEKLGILDLALEMNDATKVSVEIQVRPFQDWEKRELFYTCKRYVEDLRSGQKYGKLKKCISISILDFNLNEHSDKCHNVYNLRDKNGNIYSEDIEIHIIELKKTKDPNSPVGDWVDFFNASSKEEFEMIGTKSVGLKEAVKDLFSISMSDAMRAKHEAKLKAWRDEQHQIDCAREDGLQQGLQEGIGQGQEQITILIEKLIIDKRNDEIEKVVKDKEYCKRLLREYKIK